MYAGPGLCDPCGMRGMLGTGVHNDVVIKVALAPVQVVNEVTWRPLMYTDPVLA